MAEIVSLAIERRARDLTVEEAFEAYVKAKARADETGKLEDGIAAGKFWKRFLELMGGPF